MLRRAFVIAALLAVGLSVAAEADPSKGLTEGSVTLKSPGPLAFGPSGILFIADPVAATIYAIDTGDNKAAESTDRPKVEGIDEKIASLLGTEAKQVQVRDLAVNPVSGTTYLSVARGTGPKAMPVIVSVTRGGKLNEVSLSKVKYAKAALPNPTDKEKMRSDAITHIAFVKDRVLVAGLSNEEFASNLRSIPFPFDKTNAGTGVKIYHGAHGKFETHSPIRVFAPYKIGDEDHILAAYTCTPLVKMPLKSIKPGEKLEAVTVAELGNRNRPLSMVVYNKGGKDYVLMANNARGLMKIALEGVDKIEGITKRISGTAGLKYDTVEGMKGVQKLDTFGKDRVVLLIKTEDGKTNLDTIELP